VIVSVVLKLVYTVDFLSKLLFDTRSVDVLSKLLLTILVKLTLGEVKITVGEVKITVGEVK